MIDERTKNLNLPLPHSQNDLEDDVERIRESFQKTDDAVKTAEGKATWAGVSGKPATFPPSAHKHAPADLSAVVPVAKGGTGNATGNAPTAVKLATARNIALTGAVTGNVNFDGSANVSIATNGTLATTAKAGIIKPDNATIKVTADGTISVDAGKLVARYA